MAEGTKFGFCVATRVRSTAMNSTTPTTTTTIQAWRRAPVGACAGANVMVLCVPCGTSSGKGPDPGDVAAHDEGLHRLRALEGVDGLDVGHVPHDVVLLQYPVAAEQVARVGEDLPRLTGVVHLRQARDGGAELALVGEAP